MRLVLDCIPCILLGAFFSSISPLIVGSTLNSKMSVALQVGPSQGRIGLVLPLGRKVRWWPYLILPTEHHYKILHLLACLTTYFLAHLNACIVHLLFHRLFHRSYPNLYFQYRCGHLLHLLLHLLHFGSVCHCYSPFEVDPRARSNFETVSWNWLTLVALNYRPRCESTLAQDLLQIRTFVSRLNPNLAVEDHRP